MAPDRSKIPTISLGNYLHKIPSNIRVCNISRDLNKIWKKARKKINYGEIESIKEKLGKGIYSDTKTFDSYLSGKRNPPLLFIQNFSEYCNKLNVGYIDYNTILSKHVRFGNGGNSASAKLPINLTKELIYLVGAMRDGTLSKSGKYEVTFSQNNINWLKFIKKLIIKVFKPSNKPVIRYGNRVTLSNRPILEFLHNIFEIPIGNKIEWSTPTLIKNTPFSLQRYYIRGFFDSDGIAKYIGFCQANYEAIKDIRIMLEKQNIECLEIKKRNFKGKRYSMFYMNISNKIDNIKRFDNLIGCSNEIKGKYLPSVHNNTL